MPASASSLGKRSCNVPKARSQRPRQLRQVALRRRQERGVQAQRRQVGIGEIAVVVRVFFAAQGEGAVSVRVEPAGLLAHASAVLQYRNLAGDLELDGALHESKAVHVLDLGARSEPKVAAASHRDVGVAAEAPLLQVTVVHAEPDQNVTQRSQVLRRLERSSEVGLAHDLDERSAGAIQIDEGVPPHAVYVLAGILFHVDARDPRASHFPLDVDVEMPGRGQRLFVLADLIALGQVRIEVVLAREDAGLVELAAERPRGAERELDGPSVQDRQRSWKAQTDGARVRVRRIAEGRLARAEQLGPRQQLRVDFESDDGFVNFHGETPVHGAIRTVSGCASW